MDHSEEFIRFKPQGHNNKIILDRKLIHSLPASSSMEKRIRQNKYTINTQHQTQRNAHGPLSKLTLGLTSQLGSFKNQRTRAKDKMVLPKLNFTTVEPKPSHSGRPPPRGDDFSKPKKYTRDIVSNNSSDNQRLQIVPNKDSTEKLKQNNPCENVNELTETISPCLKLSTIFAEVIIMVSGLAMVTLGFCTLANESFSYKLIENAFYVSLVYVLIGAGCTVVLVAVFGCVGAINQSKWWMKVNTYVLVLLFLGLLIGGLVTFMYRNLVRRYMAENMLNLIGSYSTDSAVQEAWDATQQNLYCCGVFSAADWPRDKIPASCCTANDCVTNQIYPTGCYDETSVVVEGHIILIAGFYIGACLLVLNGVGTSCAFQKSLSTPR